MRRRALSKPLKPSVLPSDYRMSEAGRIHKRKVIGAPLPLSSAAFLLPSCPMLRPLLYAMLIGLACPLQAAERILDFARSKLNEAPEGFRSTVCGSGKPGDWKVILDESPSLLPPISPKAPSLSKRPVLAQLSRDRTDEHFPLLLWDEEALGDFTARTRFKLVDGQEEQMAGIAFRIQDEKNYYYIRASTGRL